VTKQFHLLYCLKFQLVYWLYVVQNADATGPVYMWQFIFKYSSYS